MKYIYIFLLSMFIAGCTIEEPFFEESDDFITIKSDKIRITADGQDIITLDVILKTEIDTQNAVSISCNYGFIGTDIQTISSARTKTVTITPINRTIRLFLRADSIPPTGDLIVQASLQNISVEKHFNIDWAFPEALLLTPVTDSFSSTDSIQICVSLYRVVAHATSGTQIYFEAYPDTTTGASGSIIPFSFTSGVTATAYLKSTSSLLGSIRLRAYALDANGDTLERINTYRITQ